ncbi:MAG: response regulator transcription factor [Bacillota bacterium]
MKLKVIIADDEQRICQLIVNLADWTALGMEVVDTAGNGIEALEKIALHQPHILVTDIRMPGCSGLALIEQAKKILPNLRVIIISGYAHFEYAQAAMKFGVEDYLLKPIKKTELMSTLEKLGESCKKDHAQPEDMKEQKQLRQEDISHLRHTFLRDLEGGRLEILPFLEINRRYCVTLENGKFLPLYLKVDYAFDKFTTSSLQIIETKIKHILRTTITPHSYDFLLLCNLPWCCAVINYSEEKRDDLRRLLRDCLNQLTAQKSIFGEIEFTISIGQEVKDLEELSDALQLARSGMSERLIEGTGRLLQGMATSQPKRSEKLLENYSKMIAQVQESSGMETLNQGNDLFCEQIRQLDEVRGGELIEFVMGAMSLFAISMNLPNREEVLQTFERQIQQCFEVAELFATLKAVQAEHMSQILAQEEDVATRPIRLAKQYVQLHFSENITLETVATVIGFSGSYFSAVFKKETGEGFSKYLTRVRMDKAKELLQQTNLPISEICVSVGYSDLKHFTATFKKTTDLKPGQYRKLHS